MHTELNAVPTLGSKERLAADLEHVAADATGLIHEIALATAGDLAHAKAKVKSSFGDAKAYAMRERAALGDRARSTAIATGEYVKTNPWKTLGAAAVAGLCVGFLIRRR